MSDGAALNSAGRSVVTMMYPSRTVVLRSVLHFSADLAGALPIKALRAWLAPRITIAATISNRCERWQSDRDVGSPRWTRPARRWWLGRASSTSLWRSTAPSDARSMDCITAVCRSLAVCSLCIRRWSARVDRGNSVNMAWNFGSHST